MARVLPAAILLSTGCSKKKEECAALTPILAQVRGTLDVDVSDDKNADAKSASIKTSLDAVSRARAEITNRKVTDGVLQPKTDAYGKALTDFENSARALKTFFDDVTLTNKPLADLIAASAAVEKATNAHLAALEFDEKKSLATKLRFVGDSPEDIEETAKLIEGMTYKNAEAKPAAATLAGELRKKAAIARAAKGLDAKLESLEKQSATKRSAFRDARSTLKKADGEVVGVCSTN